MSRHLDGSSSAAGHLPRHKPMEFGWLFLTIVPVGPWWSNPLFFFSIEYRLCPERRSVRGVVHVQRQSGGGCIFSLPLDRHHLRPIKSTNDECAAHILCGFGLGPSSPSMPPSAAGGVYSSSNSCCAQAHALLPVRAPLLGSAFHGTVSHLTISYGRCSLNPALSRMGMAVMARSSRPCRLPTSLHSQ